VLRVLDIAALSNSQSRSEEASSFFRELQHQIIKALVLCKRQTKSDQIP
jgi:hypothetical protein